MKSHQKESIALSPNISSLEDEIKSSLFLICKKKMNQMFYTLHSWVQNGILSFGTTTWSTYASEPQQRVQDFCLSLSDLSELWRALNVPSRAGHVKYRRAVRDRRIQNHEISLHAAGMLILFRILSPHNPRFFFHHLVPHIYTLKITKHCFETRDTLEKVICLCILQAFFLLLSQFYMNLNYWLTVGSFLQAITFMWNDLRIPRWPQFFQQRLFPFEAKKKLCLSDTSLVACVTWTTQLK